MIPLTSVIDINESLSPKALSHYGRLRSGSITGSMNPQVGASLGTVMKKLKDIADEEVTSDMRLSWAGNSREFLRAQGATTFAFILALIVVYLILAAQFESFIHPFIVMMTVPLAVCGALLALFIFGDSMNIYSQIGMILLVGLVTKNGILIVEYANNQLENDLSLSASEAAQDAASIRFRPILMTSMATIFGALPLALGFGAGGESRQSLGLAVVGGMLLATFLTLYVIPLVYAVINQRVRRQPSTELRQV